MANMTQSEGKKEGGETEREKKEGAVAMAAAKKRHRDEREREPSTVEAAALRSSGRGRLQYDGENLGVCEVAPRTA